MDAHQRNDPPTRFVNLKTHEIASLPRDSDEPVSTSRDRKPLLPWFGFGSWLYRPMLSEAIEMVKRNGAALCDDGTPLLTEGERRQRIAEIKAEYAASSWRVQQCHLRPIGPSFDTAQEMHALAEEGFLVNDHYWDYEVDAHLPFFDAEYRDQADPRLLATEFPGVFPTTSRCRYLARWNWCGSRKYRPILRPRQLQPAEYGTDDWPLAWQKANRYDGEFDGGVRWRDHPANVQDRTPRRGFAGGGFDPGWGPHTYVVLVGEENERCLRSPEWRIDEPICIESMSHRTDDFCADCRHLIEGARARVCACMCCVLL